jgi:3-dehydroquinate dehydratase-2
VAQSHSLAGTLPIYVLNGPNLNLIGSREPHLYGTATLGDIERTVAARARGLGLSVVFRQTNQEGQLIDWIHEARERAGGVILNAGGYSHTSVALLDACRALDKPLIEVHLSNPYRRESYRHHSYVSEAASGLVCGFGADGYLLAVEAMAKLIENQPVRT